MATNTSTEGPSQHYKKASAAGESTLGRRPGRSVHGVFFRPVPPSGPAPAACLLKEPEKRPFLESDLSNELCLNINVDNTVDLRHPAL